MHILLIMMFSLMLIACGREDHKELYGMKLGASINEVNDLRYYSFIEKDHFKGTDIYISDFKEGKDLFGETSSKNYEIELIEIDGILQGIEINSPFDNFISNHESNKKIEAFINESIAEYGKPTRDQDYFNGETRVIELKPKESIIYKILIVYSPNNMISVSYLTKTASDTVEQRTKERAE